MVEGWLSGESVVQLLAYWRGNQGKGDGSAGRAANGALLIEVGLYFRTSH